MSKRDGSRDLTEEQARVLREALKPYVAKCSGGARALAALMNVDGSGFGRFLNGKQGSSWGVAFRAAAMMGVTTNELFRATERELAFESIDDEAAREAARLALLDGVPRAQIEARYQGAAAKGRKGFKINDWHALLSGVMNPDNLPKAEPKLGKARQRKS